MLGKPPDDPEDITIEGKPYEFIGGQRKIDEYLDLKANKYRKLNCANVLGNGFLKLSEFPVSKKYNLINGFPFIGQTTTLNKPNGVIRLI